MESIRERVGTMEAFQSKIVGMRRRAATGSKPDSPLTHAHRTPVFYQPVVCLFDEKDRALSGTTASTAVDNNRLTYTAEPDSTQAEQERHNSCAMRATEPLYPDCRSTEEFDCRSHLGRRLARIWTALGKPCLDTMVRSSSDSNTELFLRVCSSLTASEAEHVRCMLLRTNDIVFSSLLSFIPPVCACTPTDDGDSGSHGNTAAHGRLGSWNDSYGSTMTLNAPANLGQGRLSVSKSWSSMMSLTEAVQNATGSAGRTHRKFLRTKTQLDACVPSGKNGGDVAATPSTASAAPRQPARRWRKTNKISNKEQKQLQDKLSRDRVDSWVNDSD